MSNWDSRWMELATHIAGWSKDPRTQVGCVIVRDRRILATGFNGFPSGVADTSARLYERTAKYPLIVHAEINAIASAARFGVSLAGSTAYVTFFVCSQCAGALIQCGIQRVMMPVAPEHYDPDLHRALEVEKAREMFAEANVSWGYIPKNAQD